MTVQWREGLAALAEQGLNIFASTPVDDLPRDIQDILKKQNISLSPGQTLCVVGHGGKTLWKKIPKPLADFHPVDSFSVEQIHRFNEKFIGDKALQLLYPHSHWVLPLQRLGRFLNICQPSLLGLDIHPHFGPWFAFRAVFVTSLEAPKVLSAPFASPCMSCATKPCRTACPAQAVDMSAETFKLSSCATYRLEEPSQCADRCLARLACPVGSEHRYTQDQLNYHMRRPAHLASMAKFQIKK